MKYLLLAFMLALGFWALLQLASDRVCTKNFSPEFKQTQQYKDLKCPENN